MSKLVSCSTGTQTPLVSSCLSSVVSGNCGEEGTWQGDMFEPSFERNHVFECRGCPLQLPQQAVRCGSLVRGPDLPRLTLLLTVSLGPRPQAGVG